jgi:23S rRNA (cytosine1962-C5)-methyltransferase
MSLPLKINEPALVLKAGREKSLLRMHPWVFSGAVDEIAGNPKNGETVTIYSYEKKFLAYGAYSHQSQISSRIWSWDEKEIVDAEFLKKRMKRAIRMRQQWVDPTEGSALRLIHAESDGLPGLIVDRYGDTLVMQALTAGIDRWKPEIISILHEITSAKALYERSDVDVRQLEGLEPECGLIWGEPIQNPIEIEENGLRYLVDVEKGHKTGFYIDQRANRKFVRKLCNGKNVLNCFSYTGGFTLNALEGGAASVISVDSSADALEIGRQNRMLNELEDGRAEDLEGDVFLLLRKFRDQAKSFDLIILDPPKFAPTAAQVKRASRGYKDINLLALKLLNPGGTLITFSCSGGISEDLFQKIVAGAALDAKMKVQIIDRLHQGADHPVALNFPEGAYLKGLVCRKMD